MQRRIVYDDVPVYTRRHARVISGRRRGGDGLVTSIPKPLLRSCPSNSIEEKKGLFSRNTCTCGNGGAFHKQADGSYICRGAKYLAWAGLTSSSGRNSYYSQSNKEFETKEGVAPKTVRATAINKGGTVRHGQRVAFDVRMTKEEVGNMFAWFQDVMQYGGNSIWRDNGDLRFYTTMNNADKLARALKRNGITRFRRVPISEQEYDRYGVERDS